MWSIALFPCSYTDGATIIGELIRSLHLAVYTDEMLFSDVSKQFGFKTETISKVIYSQMPLLHRHKVEKEKFINCLKCSLDAQTMSSLRGRLHYGLHASLLDSQKNRVVKVLVFDDEERRVKRAIQQEGFTEKVAREHIRKHDLKVSNWTNFLYHKQAYDRVLYDVIFPLKDTLDISSDIIRYYKYFRQLQTKLPIKNVLPVPDNQMDMSGEIACAD